MLSDKNRAGITSRVFNIAHRAGLVELLASCIQNFLVSLIDLLSAYHALKFQAWAYAGAASAQTTPGRIPGGQAGEQAAREQRTATAEGRRPVGGAKEGGPPHALHTLILELLRAWGAQKARGSKAPRGRD